jgi:hypothetical protein
VYSGLEKTGGQVKGKRGKTEQRTQNAEYRIQETGQARQKGKLEGSLALCDETNLKKQSQFVASGY